MIPAGNLVRSAPAPAGARRDRVLFITPPSLFLLDERVFMSLGILKVAAVLEKAGHPVEFLDLSGIENFVDVAGIQASKTASRFVAITATTPQLPAAVKIAKQVRAVRPDVRIIAGGPHITLVHSAVKLEKKAGRTGRAHRALEKLESMFDVLVSGDGESAIFEAMRDGAPKVVDADVPKGGLFMTDGDYEATPYPARHLVDVESYKYSIEGFPATSLIAQLGCPFGCGFSVTGDTLVFSDKGFESIRSMTSGTRMIEKCEHGGSVHVHDVGRRVATAGGSSMASSVVHEGRRRVFEVRSENGLRLRATAEHPLMTLVDGIPSWREVRSLKPGDWLVIRAPDYEWPSEYVRLDTPDLPKIPNGGFSRKASRSPCLLTEDLAWLVGYLIGDGCLPADGRPSVHLCITNKVRKELHRVVFEQFGVALSDRPSSVTDEMNHGWIHSRAVYEFFVQSMGISPFDKLHVPAAVIRSPRNVVESFLRGLWDADGYSPETGTTYLSTVSHDLAREVAQLMLMLGKCPNIHEVSPQNEDWLPVYRVSESVLDRIPTQKALYKSSKSGKWYWRTPRNRRSFLGIRRDTLRKSGLTHPLDRDGWFFVQIESITPGIVEDIYDLRVPGDHNFIANGIVSHNCGGRNTNMLRRIRTRSTASVVAEIEHLHRTYGHTGFMMYDDELNVNKNIVELMDAIADLQSRLGVDFRLRGFVKSELFTDGQAASMFRAGFRWILCGFEAANPRILENINKKATLEDNNKVVEISRRHGLKIKALMSVGHPGESEKSIMDVRDWLIQQAPDDFDCTTITTYPGTPYYDEAVPHPDMPDVWTYSCKKSGDRLHSYDVDYCEIADYYKGDPSGGYHSYVFTDHLNGEQIVGLRNLVESDVRASLGIPFNPGSPGVRYEHSMGQGSLPGFILRSNDGIQVSK